MGDISDRELDRLVTLLREDSARVREDLQRVERAVLSGFQQINGRVRATETAQAQTTAILSIVQRDGCDVRCNQPPKRHAAVWGSGAAGIVVAALEGVRWWFSGR